MLSLKYMQDYLGATLRASSSVGFASASGWSYSEPSLSFTLGTVQLEKISVLFAFFDDFGSFQSALTIKT